MYLRFAGIKNAVRQVTPFLISGEHKGNLKVITIRMPLIIITTLYPPCSPSSDDGRVLFGL